MYGHKPIIQPTQLLAGMWQNYLMWHGLLSILPLPAPVDQGDHEERSPEHQVSHGDHQEHLHPAHPLLLHPGQVAHQLSGGGTCLKILLIICPFKRKLLPDPLHSSSLMWQGWQPWQSPSSWWWSPCTACAAGTGWAARRACWLRSTGRSGCNVCKDPKKSQSIIFYSHNCAHAASSMVKFLVLKNPKSPTANGISLN